MQMTKVNLKRKYGNLIKRERERERLLTTSFSIISIIKFILLLCSVPTLPDQTKKWNPLTPNNIQHLEISNDKTSSTKLGVSLKMVPGVPFPQRMELWESLFPASGPHHQIMY